MINFRSAFQRINECFFHRVRLCSERRNVGYGVLGLIQDDLNYLFNDIDNDHFFGITRQFIDQICYLPQLLKESVLRHVSGNNYEIYSKIEVKRKLVGSIGLVYDFTARSMEEAILLEKDYKERMLGEAARVLLAYWKRANQKKTFRFVDRLCNVMSEISDEKRAMYFSTKEKTEFWLNTGMLTRTKLIIECAVRMRRSKKTRIFNIFYYMLDVKSYTGCSSESNYPNEVSITVLDALQFQENSSIATALTNSTLKLRPGEIMLALTLQIKGSQKNGSAVSSFKERDLIDLAHLSKTARSNMRMAKFRLIKKIEFFASNGIIAQYKNCGEFYHIKTSNQIGNV